MAQAQDPCNNSMVGRFNARGGQAQHLDLHVCRDGGSKVSSRSWMAKWMFNHVVIGAWALTGPLFGFSDTWQLIINTGTTVVTS
jgi:hypothetical protein